MRKLTVSITVLATAMILNSGYLNDHHASLKDQGDEPVISKENIIPVRAIVGPRGGSIVTGPRGGSIFVGPRGGVVANPSYGRGFIHPFNQCNWLVC